ncbi:MAG: hypothetical protein KA767_03570 [Saprospiraceae bacterium]|nr:hypothetical protein [Saprospiraceae bacterium]MBP7642390.1 hypothetical protein [Saprospiraceae bacterium]
MKKLDELTKRFGIFILVYLGLILLFQLKPMQQAHNVYYCKIGRGFFNLVNPNYFSMWNPNAPENEKDWNTTIFLYSKAKHGNRLSNMSYVRSINPERAVYNNFNTISMLPMLFLASLFLVSPGFKWYEKLWKFFVSLLILYFFLAFFTSHVIENVMLSEGRMGDTFWHKFVALVGFYGLKEAIYIVAALSWALFFIGKLNMPAAAEIGDRKLENGNKNGDRKPDTGNRK